MLCVTDRIASCRERISGRVEKLDRSGCQLSDNLSANRGGKKHTESKEMRFGQIFLCRATTAYRRSHLNDVALPCENGIVG